MTIADGIQPPLAGHDNIAGDVTLDRRGAIKLASALIGGGLAWTAAPALAREASRSGRSPYADFRGNAPRTMNEVMAWHAKAPPAVAIEPNLPIVDPHHHLFGTPADAQYYRLQDLEADLNGGHHILGTVYVEAYDSGWRKTGPEAFRPIGETEQIVRLTPKPVALRTGPCRIAAGIVCYADLSLGDRIAPVLEQQVTAGAGRLRGVRNRTATAGGAMARIVKDLPRPGILTEPGFRKGFAHLAAHSLSFDTYIYFTQIGEVLALADAFPNTVIIVNHIAVPIGVAQYRAQHAEVIREWTAGVRQLAARPNVRMKIGGLGMPTLGYGFESADRPADGETAAKAWRPRVETCIELFGAHRCMFESNFSPDKQSISYTNLWNAFKIITKGASEDDRRDLFYRTACDVYRLPDIRAAADRI